MEAKIEFINIHNDGIIEMVVVCNSCGKQNIHNLTNALTKTNNNTVINFSKLGKRCCDNHGQNGKPICYADYNLYN